MRLWILSGLMLMLVACQQEEEPITLTLKPDSPVVATVNGVSIHEADIDAEMMRLPDHMFQLRGDPVARSKVLHSLIRRHAVSQKATELGLELDPVIARRMENMRRQILIEAAKEWHLANSQPIQEAEIASYYQQHLAEFTVPEQVHARHILLKTEKQAWEVLNKLRRNRDSFSGLAASMSLDEGNKMRGGDLNWFPRGVMVKAFDDVVFRLKQNGLSKPVKTRFGWHVIELLGRRAESVKSLQEVREEIVSVLQHRRLESWYEELEAVAAIEIVKPEYRQNGGS